MMSQYVPILMLDLRQGLQVGSHLEVLVQRACVRSMLFQPLLTLMSSLNQGLQVGLCLGISGQRDQARFVMHQQLLILTCDLVGSLDLGSHMIFTTPSNADSDVRTTIRPTCNGRASLIDRRHIRPHDIRRRCRDEEAAKNCPGEFEWKTPGRHAPDEETTGELQDGLPRPGLSHLERSEKVPWGKCEVDLGRTPATQRALVPERKTGMDPGQMPCGKVPRLDSPAFHQFAEEVFQRMTEKHRNENIG